MSVPVRIDWLGDVMPLEKGFAIPRQFRAFVDDPAMPYTFGFDVEPSATGEPRITELTIRPREGQAIGTENLRRLNISRYLQAARTAATLRARGPGKLTRVRDEDIPDLYEIYRPVRGAPKPRLSDEALARAVEVYRQAVIAGDPPTQTVAKVLHLERSTAGRWMVEARRRGLLGPALARKAGEQPLRKGKR